MSKFWQVVALKLFQSLPCLVHSIYILPEHALWAWATLHLLMLLSLSSTFMVILHFHYIEQHWNTVCVCLCIYSISALDWLESHKSSVGCHRSSQPWDLWWGELVETCWQLEKLPKGLKGLNVFCSLLMRFVKMEEILTKKNDEIQGKSLDNGRVYKSLTFNKFYT